MWSKQRWSTQRAGELKERNEWLPEPRAHRVPNQTSPCNQNVYSQWQVEGTHMPLPQKFQVDEPLISTLTHPFLHGPQPGNPASLPTHMHECQALWLQRCLRHSLRSQEVYILGRKATVHKAPTIFPTILKIALLRCFTEKETGSHKEGELQTVKQLVSSRLG